MFRWATALLGRCRLSRVVGLSIVTLIIVAAPGAAQQVTTASLSGRVLDATGAGVPGAAVTVSQPPDGLSRTIVTDASGRYEFRDLPAGVYDVSVVIAGFAPAVRRAVHVTAAEPPRNLQLTLEASNLAESVTVTATRVATPIAAIPSSITVVDRELLENQAALTRSLSTILAKTLPGLGLSRESETNFGQSLRGRGMLVLLDGVPQNFELRQGALDELSRIDPSHIERVEVVRGASAAYGSEAAGGIINIITRSSSQGAPTLRSELGTTFSATHMGDSGAFRVFQDVGGTTGRVDYFAAAGIDTRGSAFDADGDRIPETLPVGIADTTALDVGGRVGVRVAPQQQLAFSTQVYWAQRETSFRPTGGVVGLQKASAVEVPVGIGDPADVGFAADRPYKRQGTYRVSYDHANVGGSQISAQVLHLHYNRLNDYFSFGGGQLNPRFRKTGARLDIHTPLRLADGAALTWGSDFVAYRHHEPLNTGLPWTPPLDQRSLAGFVQASVPVGPRVTIRGGLRYEDFTVDVDDFRQNPAFGGRTVGGGTLDYDATTVNIGGVVSLVDGLQVFAGFNQGFSITQVGRLLVNTPLSSVADARPEPAKVDSYEVGLRGSLPKVQYTLAGFYATSDLGINLVTRGVGPPEVIRAPERTFGVEATVDLQPIARWRWGGTASWQGGEDDQDFDGVFTTMDGLRIAPVKLTGYLQHDTLPRWQNRVQVTYSGKRDEFPGSSEFGQGKVDDVTLVDFVTSLRLPRGSLMIGVENLFNAFYFPPVNEAFNDDFNYIAGRGRTVSITFALPWSR